MAESEYPSIDKVGVEFTLDDEIVEESTVHYSCIYCGWTDGQHGCCECFMYKGKHRISVRETLERAAKEGWIVVRGIPVCGRHSQDADDEEIDDIERMVQYLDGG